MKFYTIRFTDLKEIYLRINNKKSYKLKFWNILLEKLNIIRIETKLSDQTRFVLLNFLHFYLGLKIMSISMKTKLTP